MNRLTTQFYEDNLLGYIRFRDVKQNEPGTKAQPKHIKILSDELSRETRKEMRIAIADDINGCIKPILEMPKLPGEDLL